ncbi:LIM domain-containing protein [Ditylenchus destructor]|nr:LIM domain-containing protein [Ditylenchus destructor]
MVNFRRIIFYWIIFSKNSRSSFGVNCHKHCFQCSTCGAELSDNQDSKEDSLQQHFFVEGKFYCNVHGKQRQIQLKDGLWNWSKTTLDPDLAVKLPPTAAQPMRIPEPPNGASQPNLILNGEGNGHYSFARKKILSELNERDNNECSYNTSNQKRSTKFVKRESSNHSQTQKVTPSAIKESLQSSPFLKDLQRNLLSNHSKVQNNETKNVGMEKSPTGQDRQKMIQRVKNRKETEIEDRIQCEYCREEIGGTQVLANGKAWCPDHFVCSNQACARPLLNCGFVEQDDGLNYCVKCYESLLAPHCAKCGLAITEDCLRALDKTWHPKCFVCAHCRKPFEGVAFYVENNSPYCENDWNELFTTKCTVCKSPIKMGERWVEALGGSAFHIRCFNCKKCNQNLHKESFYARDGQPYCKAHA